MLLHNLSMAMHQLTKYKLQTLLSLVGLAVGFTCFALSSLWWRYETTYDAFHPEAENLYLQITSNDDWVRVYPTTRYSASFTTMERIPQVERATTFRRTHVPLSVNEKVPAKVTVVDSLYLPIFQPELIAGSYPLMHPDGNGMVITDELALKLFNTTNCIGNEVNLAFQSDTPATIKGKMWENGIYTVAAVVKDWGEHTLFPFDCLIPFKSEEIAEQTSNKDRIMLDYHNIMRLHVKADADTVSALIDKIEEFGSMKTRVVRLKSFRTEYSNADGLIKINHIRIFALLGGLVVVCAVFNYLSLYVIRIRMRTRELALRLACGSSRKQLLTLLSTEFVLLLLASSLLGMLFIGLTLPEFKDITHIEEEDSFFFIEMGIYMLVVILGTLPLLAGVTWWVQHQSLNRVLHKGQSAPHGHRSLFCPLSQWVQLSISMGLVFFTSVIILQLHYLRSSTDIGFRYENRAIFESWKESELTEEMTHYLRSHPDVDELKAGCNDIAYSYYRRIIFNEDRSERKAIAIKGILREEADFWGLELLEGRWIENHEKKVAMANESAVRVLNLTHPVDTFLQNLRYNIVGVVRNVSSRSLIVPQEPMLYIPKTKDETEEQKRRSISFSYRSGSWPALRDSISIRFDSGINDWNIYGNGWSITNVDRNFNQLLHSEDTLLGLFHVMTGVCILIALFGVYSLITISCEQRRKEIAVRKVFGARVDDILRLFFGEQLVVLLLAALVGFPVAYVCVKPWLEGYIHQVEIPLWLCPAIFVGVTLLVSLCIGWRVWRTAKAHPANEICKG